MKCRLLRPMEVKDPETDHFVMRPAGFEIEHRHCYLHVNHGIAEAADDECRAASVSPEQAARAAEVYPEVAAGIAPEDRELFRAGKITGYRPDFDPANDLPSTQYVAGPNWTEADAQRIDYGEDDDDDDDEDADESDTQRTAA